MQYAKFSTTPEYRLIKGKTGMLPVYRLLSVYGQDVTGGNYYWCKAVMSLISMGQDGECQRGAALSRDKYGKQTIRQRYGSTKFTRPIKVDPSEVIHSVETQL